MEIDDRIEEAAWAKAVMFRDANAWIFDGGEIEEAANRFLDGGGELEALPVAMKAMLMED